MIPSDSPVFIARLGELADVFDKRRPNEHALKVWLHTLKEFPIADVCDALTGWAKVGSKFPAPGDIWKRLNELRAEKIEQTAIEEKEKFQREASKTFQRSDVFAKKLRWLLRDMQEEQKRDPKAWANRIIECYCERNLWPGTGEALTMYQIHCAQKALGLTTERLEQLRADRDAGNEALPDAIFDCDEEPA